MKLPLAVDLDGTLCRTDTLWEMYVRVLGRSPWRALVLLLVFFRQGRPAFKAAVARAQPISLGDLPLNEDFLAYLNSEKAGGRTIVLATAADREFARQLVAPLGVFEDVLGSKDEINLKSAQKGAALAERFGEKGFVYAGNETADIKVWARAGAGIAVTLAPSVRQSLEGKVEWEAEFPPALPSRTAWWRALRPHQWVKNLLLFVPWFTAHAFLEGWSSILPVVLAFLAFSLGASALYLLNDLLDVASDRRHPDKFKRPFAAGVLPLQRGLIAVPLLLSLAILPALFLPDSFVRWLLFYLLLSGSYSFLLKRLVVADVIVLAGLYLTRILAGGEAAGIEVSFWLMALAVFLFLSLGFLKRAVELWHHSREFTDESQGSGRGYEEGDVNLVAQFGVASAFLAVLVFAFYLQSETVSLLYQTASFLWVLCLFLLYALARLWILAKRGRVASDPVLFVVTDPASYLLGVAGFIVFLLSGPLGLPL
jgi:4-hydroxybenzoate polyprenyltransferase